MEEVWYDFVHLVRNLTPDQKKVILFFFIVVLLTMVGPRRRS
jgi:hypothetical protein